MIRKATFTCTLVLLISLAGSTLGQDKDIRLYNLEKEYQKLKTVIFHPKKASALELQLIVENMISIYGNVYINEKDNALYITDTPEMVRDLEKVLRSLDKSGITAGSNLVTKTIPLLHVVASDIISLVQHKLSKYGTILNYSDQNALVITDIKSKIDKAELLIAELDKPVQHIEIEVVIAEMNLEVFEELGVNVFEWLSNISNQILIRKGRGLGAPGEIAVGINDANMHTMLPAPFSLTDSSQRVDQAVISAKVSLSDLVKLISEQGRANVLASPRIITKNNNTAALNAREVIPFKFEPSPMPGTGQTSNMRYVLSGIVLQVLPVVQHDSTINMRIQPSISDLTGWDPKGLPIVFERSMSTEVTVKNGETFVLGGLKRAETIKKRTGVPGLKNIPVLGYLFSVKREVKLEREVLIFVRPKLVTQASFTADKNKLRQMQK